MRYLLYHISSAVATISSPAVCMSLFSTSDWPTASFTASSTMSAMTSDSKTLFSFSCTISSTTVAMLTWFATLFIVVSAATSLTTLLQTNNAEGYDTFTTLTIFNKAWRVSSDEIVFASAVVDVNIDVSTNFVDYACACISSPVVCSLEPTLWRRLCIISYNRLYDLWSHVQPPLLQLTSKRRTDLGKVSVERVVAANLT